MTEGMISLYRLSAIAACPLLILFIAVVLVKKKNGSLFRKKNVSLQNENEADIINMPAKEIVLPLTAKTFSFIGIIVFFAAFGLVGLFSVNAGISSVASVAISLCLGLTACVSASQIVYAIRLKYDSNIIFVPRSIGLKGKVFENIPARQKGQGSIRLVMNGCVTQITAFSGDETALTKGTDIKVVYADSDKAVIVERYLKDKEESSEEFNASKYY